MAHPSRLHQTEARKSPSEVQAQLAAFAGERLQDTKDRAYILGNLALLAAGEVAPIHRTATRIERRIEDFSIIEKEVSTDHIVAAPEEYTQYLQEVGGRRHQGIQGRKRIIETYNDFAPVVAPFLDEINQLEYKRDASSYVGAGMNSMVFAMEKDGQKYAVRVPRGIDAQPAAIDARIKGAIAGRGIPHLEQIVAASYENGITIAELLPGKEIDTMTLQEAALITPGQINEFVDTLITAHTQGIDFDPKAANCLYAPEEGFSFVDYDLVREGSDEVRVMQDMFIEMGDSLGTIGFEKWSMALKTSEDYYRTADAMRGGLGILQCYREAIAQRVNTAQKRALDEIDAKISRRMQLIKEYDDPTWVEARISEDEARRQQRAAAPKPRKSAAHNGWIAIEPEEI